MSWNYRIVRHVSGKETTYALHEAFFEEDGLVHTITEEPVTGYYSTPQELVEDLLLMRTGARKSIDNILDYAAFAVDPEEE